MRSIDRTSRLPPWRQIANDLETDIAAGRYEPSGRLPSISTLVQTYEVNKNTAHKALSDLKKRGLIESELGMGYYVKRPPLLGVP